MENNLRIIGTAPKNNYIVTPPLLANYNLEWYVSLQKKGNTNAKRTVLESIFTPRFVWHATRTVIEQ